MQSHFKKLLILPMISIMAGCTSLAESAGSAQAAFDDTVMKGRMENQAKYAQEYSKTIMAHSKELCETTNSDTPEATRQTSIDACIEYVYTSVMTKAQTDISTRSNQRPVQPVTPAVSSGTGQKVYRADECIGAVVNGKCHGSIIPKGYAPTCYGTMLNGQCTGPMF